MGQFTTVELLVVTALILVIAFSLASVYRTGLHYTSQVKIYILPYVGDRSADADSWRTRIMAQAASVERQFGAIVDTTIYSAPLPAGKLPGYDHKTRIYYVAVQFDSNMSPLGYTPYSTVFLNHAKLADSFALMDANLWTETERQNVCANVLMHETVHAIEHLTTFRHGVSHELAGGLMTGPPFSAEGPSYLDMRKGLIPFSSTTARRLRTAVGLSF